MTIDRTIEECREALKGITPLPWTADDDDLYIFAGGTMEKGFTKMVADEGDGEHPNLTVRMRGFGGGEPQERNLHAIATIMNAAPLLIERIVKSDARLRRIAEIIEAVDRRCMATDGPVTPTLEEVTQEEISEIYTLASEVK
jgi:hypothetical protein